ncbi:MAG: Uma2 family endonuclease [Bryobacterales bacterium]|nr:Uma2 family endonuclease [Bryobacterales bacterium]MBV9399306.1 Uma2 family endonuclease [Bryobacterales bacterium]
MVSPLVEPATLTTGEKMDRTEFLCRWEALPELKSAELIGGVVFVASPVSLHHGERDSTVIWWLRHYAIATPGCEVGNNTTWWMLEDAPQPDAHLRIRPEFGGQASIASNPRYLAGAPELAVEVCLTSTEVDFGPKLQLYRRAGVREYITIELFAQRIIWRILRDRIYYALEADPDNVFRSITFPGLWLNRDAFWRNDGAGLLAALQAGLATPEHEEFVARLRR